MKTLYLAVLICLFLSANSVTMHAQSPWPGGLPPTAKAMRVENSYCVVNGEQLWPNSMVWLHDVNSLTIGMSMADANGKASITYNCYYTPYSSTSCSFLKSCFTILVEAESTLPAKLTSFTAEVAKNNSVVLNWKSAVEVRSSSYIVQKSFDGKKFNDIGEIKAAGNADMPMSYSFTDMSFNGSLSYFRLKQMDVDGRFEYSRIIYVNGKKNGAEIQLISSNLYTGEIRLAGIAPTELLNKNIRVYNTSGQPVAYLVTGGNSIAIDASSPSGIYLLRIKDKTFKLYKNKQ